MGSPEDRLIERLDPLLDRSARGLHGRGGAEYDDLFQEGRLAALLYYRETAGAQPDEHYAIRGRARMIDWCRYCKRGYGALAYDEEIHTHDR